MHCWCLQRSSAPCYAMQQRSELKHQQYGIADVSAAAHGLLIIRRLQNETACSRQGTEQCACDAQADAAIEAVNGQVLGAATLEVKHADADAGRGQVRSFCNSRKQLPDPGSEPWQQIMHGAVSLQRLQAVCTTVLTLRPQALPALCLLPMHHPS